MGFVTKKFSELEEGDLLVGPTGDLVPVRTVYASHVPASMYQLEGPDGQTIEVSGNHLWYVETTPDQKNHAVRVKKASRIFKKLSEDSLSCLQELIDMEAEVVRADLGDMLDFCDCGSEDEQLREAVVRIAVSLGPIEEENTIQEDVETGTVLSEVSKRIYDARKFAKQIFALRDGRKNDVIVGRVVTTEQMLILMPLGVHIPELT